ncbi:10123_t:CDS:1 [Dentiscutata erythropus]|uniref:10123_t:CDS:1 n=1 Tax=Dentiscutata erythropus TaxID=1348616 RepID=A0A9N9IZY0_9GLOM|nr:10123_t:CDS:1 [Dentiscutata erythropus]
MPSHIALLAVIISIKNNSISSYGLAKYKPSEQTSRTIRWKYFFSNNSSSQLFAPGDLVFFSGKCAVEDSQQCITVASASIVDNQNPNREFDLTSVPICVPHCMISVVVNHNAKQTEEFIYFGVECVEYNSVTGSSNVKIEMTVLYPVQSKRFKYLGSLGSNITVGNTYIVSGFFRFSDSGKIMIEATDIDYSKPPVLTFNILEISSSSSSHTHSILDIIADDIYFTSNHPSKKPSYSEHDAIPIPSSSKVLSTLPIIDVEATASVEKSNCIDLDAEDKDNNSEHNSEHEYSENENLLDENDQEEDYQPKKRKRGTKTVKKNKGKRVTRR